LINEFITSKVYIIEWREEDATNQFIVGNFGQDFDFRRNWNYLFRQNIIKE
jgi:hypothetical protein